jgi:hypothetical protein
VDPVCQDDRAARQKAFLSRFRKHRLQRKNNRVVT